MSWFSDLKQVNKLGALWYEVIYIYTKYIVFKGTLMKKNHSYNFEILQGRSLLLFTIVGNYLDAWTLIMCSIERTGL